MQRYAKTQTLLADFQKRVADAVLANVIKGHQHHCHCDLCLYGHVRGEGDLRPFPQVTERQRLGLDK